MYEGKVGAKEEEDIIMILFPEPVCSAENNTHDGMNLYRKDVDTEEKIFLVCEREQELRLQKMSHWRILSKRGKLYV